MSVGLQVLHQLSVALVTAGVMIGAYLAGIR